MKSIEVVWGQNGLLHANEADIVVIVDVLSFCSAIDAACSSGARVYPYSWRDESVFEFAKSLSAMVAVQRQDSEAQEPSLSPPSLVSLPKNSRLVLPSPNGSTLASMSRATTTIGGCLRNASAVARYINSIPGSAVVVAAGERWPDGSLRPALEDFLGAGAIVTELKGRCSGDAKAAIAVFKALEPNLSATLNSVHSGTELIERGFSKDVDFAAQINRSEIVPILVDGCFVASNATG